MFKKLLGHFIKRISNNYGFWNVAVPAAMGVASHFLGKDGGDEIEAPEYWDNPEYEEVQKYLKDFGMGVLEGDVPDYYKAIGETGSDEFEDMMSMVQRDIMQSTSESLAKSGRARGGQLGASTAGAIGDATTTARYGDYERALAGKQNLLGLGIGTTEGARSSAQAKEGMKNTWNWDQYLNELDLQREEDEGLGGLIGSIAGIGMNAISAGSGSGTGFLSKLGSIFKKKPTTSGGGGLIGSLGKSGDLASKLGY